MKTKESKRTARRFAIICKLAKAALDTIRKLATTAQGEAMLDSIEADLEVVRVIFSGSRLSFGTWDRSSSGGVPARDKRVEVACHMESTAHDYIYLQERATGRNRAGSSGRESFCLRVRCTALALCGRRPFLHSGSSFLGRPRDQRTAPHDFDKPLRRRGANRRRVGPRFRLPARRWRKAHRSKHLL